MPTCAGVTLCTAGNAFSCGETTAGGGTYASFCESGAASIECCQCNPTYTPLTFATATDTTKDKITAC